MRCNALLLAASTGLLLPEVYAQTSGTPPDFFEMKVRPVLANSCYSCHAGTAMGGLRLDSRDAMLKGGSHGAAVDTLVVCELSASMPYS
jgi:Planctomycete cytochrome C